MRQGPRPCMPYPLPGLILRRCLGHASDTMPLSVRMPSDYEEEAEANE